MAGSIPVSQAEALSCPHESGGPRMSLSPCLAVGPASPCAWNVCVSRDTPLVASDGEEDEQKAVTSEAVSTGTGQEVPLLPTSAPRCTGGLAVPSTVLAWEQAGSVGERHPGVGCVFPRGSSSRVRTGLSPATTLGSRLLTAQQGLQGRPGQGVARWGSD